MLLYTARRGSLTASLKTIGMTCFRRLQGGPATEEILGAPLTDFSASTE